MGPTSRKGAFPVAFLLGLALAGAPRPAWAQDVPGPSAPSAADSATPEEAKRKGDEAMVAIRFEEALVHYKKAYDATHNPALLYNMGRAYEGLADFPKALDALEEFNEKAPADLKARVPKLEELLRDVRNRVATLVVSSNLEDADIRVGNRVIGKTRTGQVVLRVNAGASRVSVVREGYFPIEKDVPLAGGKIETVDATLSARGISAVLRITSPVTGAAASVDGKGVGVVPAEAIVSPGQHKVLLQRDGYEPAQTNAVIGAGERKDLDLPMNKKDSLAGKWWFWTAIGAAVVAGTVTTIVIANTEKDPGTGTIAPGRVKAELKIGF